MFKGILPPRRALSPEFTIVSPLVENGKENLPSPPPVRPEASPNGKVVVAAPKSAKAAAHDKSKRRKGDVSHTAPASNSTDHEFDRLLVRARDRTRPAAMRDALLTQLKRTVSSNRMTSKFHLRFVRS